MLVLVCDFTAHFDAMRLVDLHVDVVKTRLTGRAGQNVTVDYWSFVPVIIAPKSRVSRSLPGW